MAAVIAALNERLADPNTVVDLEDTIAYITEFANIHNTLKQCKDSEQEILKTVASVSPTLINLKRVLDEHQIYDYQNSFDADLFKQFEDAVKTLSTYDSLNWEMYSGELTEYNNLFKFIDDSTKQLNDIKLQYDSMKDETYDNLESGQQWVDMHQAFIDKSDRVTKAIKEETTRLTSIMEVKLNVLKNTDSAIKAALRENEERKFVEKEVDSIEHAGFDYVKKCRTCVKQWNKFLKYVEKIVPFNENQGSRLHYLYSVCQTVGYPPELLSKVSYIENLFNTTIRNLEIFDRDFSRFRLKRQYNSEDNIDNEMSVLDRAKLFKSFSSGDLAYDKEQVLTMSGAFDCLSNMETYRELDKCFRAVSCEMLPGLVHYKSLQEMCKEIDVADKCDGSDIESVPIDTSDYFKRYYLKNFKEFKELYGSEFEKLEKESKDPAEFEDKINLYKSKVLCENHIGYCVVKIDSESGKIISFDDETFPAWEYKPSLNTLNVNTISQPVRDAFDFEHIYKPFVQAAERLRRTGGNLGKGLKMVPVEIKGDWLSKFNANKYGSFTQGKGYGIFSSIFYGGPDLRFERLNSDAFKIKTKCGEAVECKNGELVAFVQESGKEVVWVLNKEAIYDCFRLNNSFSDGSKNRLAVSYSVNVEELEFYALNALIKKCYDLSSYKTLSVDDFVKKSGHVGSDPKFSKTDMEFLKGYKSFLENNSDKFLKNYENFVRDRINKDSKTYFYIYDDILYSKVFRDIINQESDHQKDES